MPHRHQQPDAALGEGPLRVAKALRDVLLEGYSARDLRADVMAGVDVGIVTSPLAMALAMAPAIASEVARLESRRPGSHH